MSKEILESERLILREFEVTDAYAMYQLNDDVDVMKYVSDRPFNSIHEAESFLKQYNHYERHGFGRWAVIVKDSQRFIGWCGLKQHERGFVDLGFRLIKKEWGKGYATESALAALQYGFVKLGIREIVGRAAAENGASIRVLEKIGMEFWKREECDGFENALYYRIAKEQFPYLNA